MHIVRAPGDRKVNQGRLERFDFIGTGSGNIKVLFWFQFFISVPVPINIGSDVFDRWFKCFIVKIINN